MEGSQLEGNGNLDNEGADANDISGTGSDDVADNSVALEYIDHGTDHDNAASIANVIVGSNGGTGVVGERDEQDIITSNSSSFASSSDSDQQQGSSEIYNIQENSGRASEGTNQTMAVSITSDGSIASVDGGASTPSVESSLNSSAGSSPSHQFSQNLHPVQSIQENHSSNHNASIINAVTLNSSSGGSMPEQHTTPMTSRENPNAGNHRTTTHTARNTQQQTVPMPQNQQPRMIQVQGPGGPQIIQMPGPAPSNNEIVFLPQPPIGGPTVIPLPAPSGQNGGNRMQIRFNLAGPQVSQPNGIQSDARATNLAHQSNGVVPVPIVQDGRGTFVSISERSSQGGAPTPVPVVPRSVMANGNNFVQTMGATTVQINSGLPNFPGMSAAQIILPPLVPQPLPASRLASAVLNHAGETDKKTADKWKEKLPGFVCSICLEFMDDPAGCGKEKCTGRFCFSCLEKVIQTTRESNPRQPQQNQQHSAKCPLCRSPIDESGDNGNANKTTIKRDEALREKMDRWNPEEQSNSSSSVANDKHRPFLVSCSHPACTRLLRLREVKCHEQSCDKVIVQCRYASFGCKWVGPKEMLKLHERLPSNSNRSSCPHTRNVLPCPYFAVDGLVQQYRVFKVTNDRRLEHMQQHVAGVSRLLGTQHQNLEVVRSKSPDDLLDVALCVYTALCHTVKFLFAKDIVWRQVVASPRTRGKVYNSLVFFPTMLLASKSLMEGITTMIDSFPMDMSKQEVDYELLAQIVIPIILFVLGCITVLCFSLDKSDATSWTKLTISNDINIFLMRDLASISTAMFFHIWITDFFHSTLKGVLAAYCILISSEFMPSVMAPVLALAGSTSGNGYPAMAMDYDWHSKARQVILFGMRYGLLISTVGFIEAMDSVICLGLVQQVLKSSFVSLQNEFLALGKLDCFLGELNYGYIGTARAAMALALQAIELEHAKMVVKAIQGAAILCLINILVFVVGRVGRQVGTIIATKGKDGITVEARTQRILLASTKSASGFVVLSCWLLSIGIVLHMI